MRSTRDLRRDPEDEDAAADEDDALELAGDAAALAAAAAAAASLAEDRTGGAALELAAAAAAAGAEDADAALDDDAFIPGAACSPGPSLNVMPAVWYDPTMLIRSGGRWCRSFVTCRNASRSAASLALTLASYASRRAVKVS